MQSESPESPPESPQDKPRKGIYLLPNLFTTAGLFAGFYAIVAATVDHFEYAAIAIFIAMLMDGLDGRVARMTHTQSDFGAEYDSLTDMVCFGLAPALIMHEWALRHMLELGWVWGKLGWLAAFVYTAGAALRLARFNTQVGIADKRYFQGLPSPSAAAVVAGMVWVGDDLGVTVLDWSIPGLVLTVLMGLLMVSNIRYHSFKELDLRNKVPFVAVLLIVLVFVFASIDPPKVFFGGFLLYALSGPVITLWYLRKRRQQRADRSID